MEPPRKRFRSENGCWWSNPRVSIHRFGNGSCNLECKRFNTPEGCSFGSTCRFRHVSADGQDISLQGLSSGGKPKPCMKFFSTYGCPFGESCHFDHYVPGGLSSLGLSPIVSFSAAAPSMTSQRKKVALTGDSSVAVNGYKTKPCNRFNTAEGCRFGDKCHFAHGESELRLSNNHIEGNSQRAPSGPGMDHPGYANEGTDFGNAEAVGNRSSFTSQGSGDVIPAGVTVGDSAANYDAGPTGENVQVC